jgi:hypothetical protein
MQFQALSLFYQSFIHKSRIDSCLQIRKKALTADKKAKLDHGANFLGGAKGGTRRLHFCVRRMFNLRRILLRFCTNNF